MADEYGELSLDVFREAAGQTLGQLCRELNGDDKQRSERGGRGL